MYLITRSPAEPIACSTCEVGRPPWGGAWLIELGHTRRALEGHRPAESPLLALTYTLFLVA